MLFRPLLLMLALLSVWAAPVAAQPPAVAVLEVAPFFGGSFKGSQWLPLRVTVSNDGPDRRAMVQVDSGGATSFATEVELPRGARKAVMMYVRPEAFARVLRARLMDGDEQLAAVEVDVNPISATKQVIGVLTERPLSAPPPTDSTQQTGWEMLRLIRADLPGRAEGWASFDALLFDHSALDGMSADQARALEDWVRSGGQLVASLQAASLDRLPERLRIATIGAVAPTPVTATMLSDLGEVSVDAATLTPNAEAMAVDALTVHQELGTGHVTLIGYSLSDPLLQELPGDTTFWSSLLRVRRADPNLPPGATIEDQQAQQIVQALFNLPALAMPPLGVLIALLLLYIALVGPGLYLVLRRLDRQAWAWIAIPALTLLFTAGAYGYGMRIRGDDVILNQVNYVQVTDGRAHVRTFAGIFSPQTTGYDIAVAGDALPRPVRSDPKMWGMQGASDAGGQYIQGSGEVRDLEVAQWSMSVFAAETYASLQTLSADLELGEGVLRGVVRNTGDALVRDVTLVQSNRTLLLGDLAPGAAKQVEFEMDGRPAFGGESIGARMYRGRYNPQAAVPAEIRLPMQLIDSLYSYTPWARSSKPLLLGWLDANPLPMEVRSPRVQQQPLTLVEVPVAVTYAQQVSFPHEWNRFEYEADDVVGACTTKWGSGMMIRSDVVTGTLRLPQVTRDMQVEETTMFATIEGPMITTMLVEAYDWANDQWISVGEIANDASIELDDPERFFKDGVLRARVKLPSNAFRDGCLTLDATVGGGQ